MFRVKLILLLIPYLVYLVAWMFFHRRSVHRRWASLRVAHHRRFATTSPTTTLFPSLTTPLSPSLTTPLSPSLTTTLFPSLTTPPMPASRRLRSNLLLLSHLTTSRFWSMLFIVRNLVPSTMKIFRSCIASVFRILHRMLYVMVLLVNWSVTFTHPSFLLPIVNSSTSFY